MAINIGDKVKKAKHHPDYDVKDKTTETVTSVNITKVLGKNITWIKTNEIPFWVNALYYVKC